MRSFLSGVAPHPDKKAERRVLVSVKCNLSKPPKTLVYHLEQNADEVLRVVWDGELDEDGGADSFLRPSTSREDRPSKLDEAVGWLRARLSDGPKPSKQIEAAADEVGIALRTLERAKDRLGVRVEQERFTKNDGKTAKRWIWSLDDNEVRDSDQ